jgi:hypothetical protein
MKAQCTNEKTGERHGSKPRRLGVGQGENKGRANHDATGYDLGGIATSLAPGPLPGVSMSRLHIGQLCEDLVVGRVGGKVLLGAA